MQVDVSCTARVPSSSGRPGQGQIYFSSQPGQPLHWVVGSGKVSPYLSCVKGVFHSSISAVVPP